MCNRAAQDSIVEVNGTTGKCLSEESPVERSFTKGRAHRGAGDVAQMLDKCKTDVELESASWSPLLRGGNCFGCASSPKSQLISAWAQATKEYW